MKKVIFFGTKVLLSIVAAFFLVTQATAQYENYTGAVDPSGKTDAIGKPIVDYSYKYLPPSNREGGETIGTAVVITAIPFNDGGGTCDNINDYDAVCPYSGSTAPDVVYSYSPAADIYVNIDLYGSDYDTKVYVFENTVGNVVACNDDYYDYFPDYTSYIGRVLLEAGNTYYIVIDGYGGDCGEYDLVITEFIPPWCTDCLACSTPEGEPDLQDGQTDNYNGGCNTPPNYPVTPIFLNQIVCGRTNTYLSSEGYEYRDTDWYEITLDEAGTLYWSGYAPFSDLALFILGTNCDNIIVYSSGMAGECDRVTISASLDAGTYYLFAGPNFFSGMPDGQVYNVIATLNAPPPVDFCDASADVVPVSNWALYLGLALILVFTVIRFRR